MTSLELRLTIHFNKEIYYFVIKEYYENFMFLINLRGLIKLFSY
jgi:hypothetical protein